MECEKVLRMDFSFFYGNGLLLRNKIKVFGYVCFDFCIIIVKVILDFRIMDI